MRKRWQDLTSKFGTGDDPTGNTTRKLTLAAPNTTRGAVRYPDAVQFLDAPASDDDLGKIPFAAQACLVEGNQQGFKQLEIARKDIEGFAAKASELTDQADDELRVRDRAHHGWEKARDSYEFATKVLPSYILHHGKGWLWLYGLVWIGLLVGDVAGGTLVLIKAGEYPLFSALLTTSIGVAAVTSAKIAEDFRRRHLWLRHSDHIPDDEEERRLLISVFSYDEEPYRFLVKVSALIAATAVCLALGTFAIRLTVDNVFMAFGFALWAAGICGGSFVNSWMHTDPAHTALRNFGHLEDSERKNRDAAPTDAIAERAANLRGVAERLRSHESAAMALWWTKLAEAADILAANPQMSGHGTDGMSFLWTIRPTFADRFDLLFDEYQIPRHYEDRTYETPHGEDSAGADNQDRVIDITEARAAAAGTVDDKEGIDEQTSQRGPMTGTEG